MKKVKRLLRTILSVCAAAILVGVVPACTSGEPEETGPRLVAHRGYSQSYLGNTEEAFRAAAERGFYGIETDIRKTKDGYFVCNHDDSVTFDNGTTRKIAETNLATLLDQPLANDKTNQDTFLCTFETYLRVCKEKQKIAVIELKDFFGVIDIPRILEIIDREYDRKHVSIIDFNYFQLQLVKEADSSLDLQYLSQTMDDDNFDSCLREKISIDVRHDILTEELVAAFHDAGLTVNAWTVNNDSDLRAVTALDVDYVTTDVFYKE